MRCLLRRRTAGDLEGGGEDRRRRPAPSSGSRCSRASAGSGPRVAALGRAQRGWRPGTPPTEGPRRRKRNKRLRMGWPLPALALRVPPPTTAEPPGQERTPALRLPRPEGRLAPRAGDARCCGRKESRLGYRRGGLRAFTPFRHTVETRLAALGMPPHVRDLLLDHAPARGSRREDSSTTTTTARR